MTPTSRRRLAVNQLSMPCAVVTAPQAAALEQQERMRRLNVPVEIRPKALCRFFQMLQPRNLLGNNRISQAGMQLAISSYTTSSDVLLLPLLPVYTLPRRGSCPNSVNPVISPPSISAAPILRKVSRPSHDFSSHDRGKILLRVAIHLKLKTIPISTFLLANSPWFWRDNIH
eukprot:GHVT01102336.1.p1 GENE.GHVT01102336.1~~GHVT01102336.1.p1  ORF type:complete len:172 (-),score=12.20 GHVT01102336.1:2635-3150(-)